MIDPVLQQMMTAMKASGFAMPDPMTADGMRAVLNAPMPGAPIEVAEVRDVTIAGGDGPIAARLYHPAPGEQRPVAVLMHGGGWVIGTLDTHDSLARTLVREAGCALLSLDYRLAPEHRFPAPLDDCVAAVRALPERAAEFGIDASRFALVGDSAGGNLAAATALALGGTEPRAAAQILFYPVIERDFERTSYRTAPEGGFLSTGMMRFFWDQYLGGAEPDERCSPIRSTALAGAPPATIILAGNDPLHDEGLDFALALQKAGVPTDIHDFSGGIHGFASLAGVAPIADQAIALAAAAIRRALG